MCLPRLIELNHRATIRIVTWTAKQATTKRLITRSDDGYVKNYGCRKDRAVVVLNLQGGPSQFETFDPNMEAPSSIRSITGEIQTTLPGVTFGGTLPKLAVLADKMAVVRSYRHGISDHGTAAMHVMAGGNQGPIANSHCGIPPSTRPKH